MKDSIIDFSGFSPLVGGRPIWLFISILLTVSLPTVSALPPVIAFEGTDFPENEGWLPNSFCEPPRTLRDGYFQQEVAPCPGDPLPGGQQESFKQELGVYVGYNIFLEWQAQSDGPSWEIIGVAPASMVIGGNFGVS